MDSIGDPEVSDPGRSAADPGASASGSHRVGRTGHSRIAAQVGDFHRSYQLPVRVSPTPDVGRDQLELRLSLIEEEVAELREAAQAADLVGVADALADIVYVAYGTAHVYGIGLDEVLDEVHSSNMTKLGPDGRPVRRADGKILKGPAYRAPDVQAVLSAQQSDKLGK